MVKLVSFEEKFNIGDNSAKSVAKFELTDDLKATAWTTQLHGTSGLEIETKSWSIAHEQPSRTTVFKVKRKVGPDTKLTIAQKVPNNDWYLVPNPTLKLVNVGALGEHSTIEATWCALTRKTEAAVTLYGGEDKAYKAGVELESDQRKGGGRPELALKARAKLRQGLLHSIAAKVATHKAPKLSLKSRLGDDFKTDVVYDVGARTVSLRAKRMAKGGDGPAERIDTILDAEFPVGGDSLVGRRAPKIVVGVKAHF